ncbi:MAG: DNA primase [Flavobacteriales bacterium]|nr:DNA primase [Flavobacteriales bacterium]
MITRETIDRIIEAARIEEVVGDYVTLKKRGANYIGLCPFHDEKTPSFNVSPVRGIYKCFGCGKGGNAVNFLMEHEHYAYPEALRFLGKKYGIEVEDEQQTDEQKEAVQERESLYIVSAFAQRYYTEVLHNTEEGKAIGLTYLKERGVTPAMTERFVIGYAPDQWDGLLNAATHEGHNPEFLDKTGLTLSGENGKRHDRFRGRVMFPIRNVTGRVIGFGGRTLRSDKKTAKYINSPESEIYHKSHVLYGLYESRKAISEQDVCYLVEGYTDVISLHQAGVENVVASSGTSLTEGQIRLIRRYTPNVTILYDGDAAGIKASFRGIDLILEEGLNVRVVLFPDGEDPDSYARKSGGEALKEYITSNSKDFISFKTGLLWEEASGDPIKKAALIKDIVQTIALIPDAVTRSVYVKECASILQIDEQALISVLNKSRRDKARKENTSASPEEYASVPDDVPVQYRESQERPATDISFQERDLLRVLLQYGNHELSIVRTEENAEKEMEPETMSVADFIVSELSADDITLEHAVYGRIFDEIMTAVNNGSLPDEKKFLHHSDPEIAHHAIDLCTSRYQLSGNWEKRGIMVETEEMVLRKTVYNVVYALKERRVMDMIEKNQIKLKDTASDEEVMKLLEVQKLLENARKQISNQLGRVILK